MLDLTTIFYAVMVGFGVFSFDAYWNADTVKAEFAVASAYDSAGIKADFAETVYSREMREVFATPSLVKRPNVRASRDKSFVTIVAESIGLQNATPAFQDLFGMEPVIIDASLAAENGKPKIEVVGELGKRGTFAMTLPGQEGESPIALIRRSAHETAIRLDPYHASIFLMRHQGDGGLERADQVLAEAIAALPKTPQSVPRARLRNLDGIVMLFGNDKAGAAATFEQAIQDDPDFTSAHLNLAFTMVEQDRFADAAAQTRRILESRRLAKQAPMQAAAHTIAGVAAWGQKQYAVADQHFQAATKLHPGITDAYIYWGRMLAEQGRLEEGRQKRLQGEANLAEFEIYPEVALLYFWMTEHETKDAPLARR